MNLRALSLVAAVAALIASTANGQAQGTYPPAGGLTVDDLNAAIAAATPAPCPVAPSDTLLGSTGVQSPCMARPDATRPTVVQAGNVVTDSSGNWNIGFAKSFNSSSPYVHAEPVTPGATLPFDCNVTGRSATGAQGTCYQSYSTTVTGVAGAALNTTVSPFRNTAANVVVEWVAREPTQ